MQCRRRCRRVEFEKLRRPAARAVRWRIEQTGEFREEVEDCSDAERVILADAYQALLRYGPTAPPSSPLVIHRFRDARRGRLRGGAAPGARWLPSARRGRVVQAADIVRRPLGLVLPTGHRHGNGSPLQPAQRFVKVDGPASQDCCAMVQRLPWIGSRGTAQRNETAIAGIYLYEAGNFRGYAHFCPHSTPLVPAVIYAVNGSIFVHFNLSQFAGSCSCCARSGRLPLRVRSLLRRLHDRRRAHRRGEGSRRLNPFGLRRPAGLGAAIPFGRDLLVVAGAGVGGHRLGVQGLLGAELGHPGAASLLVPR
jgi:hypothetical protein